MVAHSGGPLLAMYLLPLGLSKEVYAGTTSLFFTVGNATKAVPWLLLVKPTGDVWTLMAACLPANSHRHMAWLVFAWKTGPTSNLSSLLWIAGGHGFEIIVGRRFRLCRVTLGAVPRFDTASRRALAYPGVLWPMSRAFLQLHSLRRIQRKRFYDGTDPSLSSMFSKAHPAIVYRSCVVLMGQFYTALRDGAECSRPRGAPS
jgi:hypothetical protein